MLRVRPCDRLRQASSITHAYAAVGDTWFDLGEADWTCLGTPDNNTAPAAPFTLSGEVLDRTQQHNVVPGASLTAYSDGDPSGAAIANTTAAGDGTYSLTLPGGTASPTITVQASRAIDTHDISLRLSDHAEQYREIHSLSTLGADLLYESVGLLRIPGLGLGWFRITDCLGRPVNNAVAIVSVVSGCPSPTPGGQTFYFSADPVSMPVSHSEAAATKQDGSFTVLELPPQQTVFVQVWGYISGQDVGSDEPTLLAELPFRILQNSAVLADLRPRRAP